jgi:hypothetical protein
MRESEKNDFLWEKKCKMDNKELEGVMAPLFTPKSVSNNEIGSPNKGDGANSMV